MAKKKRLGILTVALAVAVVIAGAVMVNGALKDAAKQQAEQEKIDSAQKTEEVVEEEPSELEATLFFASDYQEGEHGAPRDNLKGILNAVKVDKSSLDGMIFCGDYSNVPGKSNHEITPEPAISEIKSIFVLPQVGQLTTSIPPFLKSRVLSNNLAVLISSTGSPVNDTLISYYFFVTPSP